MKTYKVNKGFIVQKIDDKTVIFDGEESVLYTFNETASIIFKRIKAGWSKENIIEDFLRTYHVKRKQVEEDVGEMLSEMQKKKIISPLTTKT